LAEWVFHWRGIEFDFSGDNQKAKHRMFFQHANDAIKERDVFNFDEYSQVDILDRKITMINPHTNNFQGLLNAIDIMKPYIFEFYIGKNSPLADGYNIEGTFPISGRSYLANIRAKHVNVIIRGKVLDVYCIVDTAFIGSFVNVLHCYLLGHPYFNETQCGNVFYLTNSKGWFFLCTLIRSV